MIAAFFTHSRCAMLGMIAGTAVLFATTNGWRRWAMAGRLLLGVASFAARAPTSLDGAGPMEELVLRGDTGRHTIYSAIWCRMQDAFYFTFGHGLFAAEALPEDEAGSMAFHAHSMYVATFYHGGVLGLLFLLVVLFIGLQRAWTCFEALRDPVWLALLAFGMVGLMFDGSMPLRLMAITRIRAAGRALSAGDGDSTRVASASRKTADTNVRDCGRARRGMARRVTAVSLRRPRH